MMTIETLLNALNNTRVNITTCDKDTIYIVKPDPDSEWYHPDPWNEVYNTLVENGIKFTTSVHNYEDVFNIDNSNLYVVIYTEE